MNRIGLERVRLTAIAGFCALALTLPAGAEDHPGVYDSGRLPFTARVGDHVFHYNVSSLFVLPSDSVQLTVEDSDGEANYSASAECVAVEAIAPRVFRFVVPAEPGVCSLEVLRERTGDAMRVMLWVMVPCDRLEGEYLNGYRIGRYPRIPYRQLPVYLPPRGFVEVTPATQDLRVSPHFRLKEFLCKQNGDFPKYLVLRQTLLAKLELIVEKVNAAGYPCTTLAVLSGYRTPHYNKAIGNVQYSRHQWGGAADIYIDHDPVDEMMDDLTNDGKINWRDAAILYDIIDGMYGKTYYRNYVGGLARYRKTPAHGPFVHVDVRGFRARWGD